MKRTYLVLGILGFILPNIFVFKESMTSGNILLWKDIPSTFQSMFVNNISSAFAIDLLFVVVVFIYWSYLESKRLGIKRVGILWIVTMFFGLACTFPYFLYLRIKNRNIQTDS